MTGFEEFLNSKTGKNSNGWDFCHSFYLTKSLIRSLENSRPHFRKYEDLTLCI